MFVANDTIFKIFSMRLRQRVPKAKKKLNKEDFNQKYSDDDSLFNLDSKTVNLLILHLPNATSGKSHTGGYIEHIDGNTENPANKSTQQ